MSLAADGKDGNGLQLEKLRLNFSSCFCASSNSTVDTNDYMYVLFPLCELRLHLPLHVDVKRKCSEWMNN